MSRMRILIVTQYFWPENFKINDLALELNQLGHKITVLTGKPNYPEGKFYSGYSFLNPKKEIWNGIEVFRLPLIPRGKSKGIHLILNYLSFVFYGILFSLKRLKGKKFDLIFVFEVSPITVGIPAIWLKRKLKIPIYFWVLDLWPEMFYSLSGIKSKPINYLVEKLVVFINKNCDYILISSKSFKEPIVKRGGNRDRIFFLPNWAEDVIRNEKIDDSDWEYNQFFKSLEGKFKVMFAGNIGESQDIDSLIKTLIKTKDQKNIVWIFIGDGRSKEKLELAIKNEGLNETVYLLGKHPVERMPLFFSQADAMLVTLKADPVFTYTVPARIQAYMASGKPILAMISGEGNLTIREAKCGMVCESDDYEGLASNALLMSKMRSDELSLLGNSGFEYYMNNYNKTKIINNLEVLFTLKSKT